MQILLEIKKMSLYLYPGLDMNPTARAGSRNRKKTEK